MNALAAQHRIFLIHISLFEQCIQSFNIILQRTKFAENDSGVCGALWPLHVALLKTIKNLDFIRFSRITHHGFLFV